MCYLIFIIVSLEPEAPQKLRPFIVRKNKSIGLDTRVWMSVWMTVFFVRRLTALSNSIGQLAEKRNFPESDGFVPSVLWKKTEI